MIDRKRLSNYIHVLMVKPRDQMRANDIVSVNSTFYSTQPYSQLNIHVI